MTVEAAVISSGLPADPAPEATTRALRGLARQAVIDTLSRPGARFGLAWIALLLLAAVFAPFIATSFPLLVKQGGHWSSPAMRQLTPADVTWLVAFLTGALLAVTRKARFGTGVITLLWIVAFVIPLTLWPQIKHDEFFSGSAAVRRFEKIMFGVAIGIDLLLLIGLPWLSSASRQFKLAVGALAVLLAMVLIVFPVRPPQAIVYEEYRDKARDGALQWMLRAPVPFSANDYQRDDSDARLKSPSLRHLLGTEQSGADVFSRLLHACRIALSIGFIATGIAVLIGVIVGGITGYFVGTVDIVVMRVIEVFEAVPTLILLLTISAFFGRNLYLMMVLIGLLNWTGYSRFVRAEFFKLRNQDFVHAAQAAGLPLRSVIFRHMLPNAITPVLVNTSFGVASAILIESTLSFLGLGLVDEPSWGQLLNQARAGGTGFQWWLATFPGLAIFFTVFAYNLIGEAIRDAIDPRLRKRD